MDGKVALVTGAGSGIGRASVMAFARAGARVVAADLHGDAAAETASLARAEGGEADSVQSDVTDPDSVAAMVGFAVERFGRLDCAHNNAGISGSPANVADLAIDQWHATIAVDLTAVFLCMRAEVPQLLAAGGGSIVNTASEAGIVGVAGFAAYTASKHGVVGLTKAAALEYARQGIRINAVCPGVTGTPMVEAIRETPAMTDIVASLPNGRIARPEEIAATVVWLSSDAASYVNAAAILVDGGHSAQ